MKQVLFDTAKQSYHMLDAKFLSRMPLSMQLCIKNVVLRIAKSLAPGRIMATDASDLIVARRQEPQGARLPLPAWAVAEAEGLRKDVAPELVLPSGRASHVIETGYGACAPAFRMLRDFMDPGFDALFLVPWIRPGGADLGVIHYCRALCEQGARVGVIATERFKSEWASRLPEGVKFLAAGEALAGLNRRLGEPRAVLARALLQKPPERVHIVGSRLGWETVQYHGAALRSRMRVYASLFCDDEDQNGVPLGHAVDFLQATCHFLDGVLCDNSRYPEIWRKRWGVPADLFHVVPFPVSISNLPASASKELCPNLRPRCLWASRLDRQKRPDILARIAEATPGMDWDVHGTSIFPGQHGDISRLHRLSNVVLHGEYSSFSTLVRPEHRIFVYTSQWDGLPNVVLEAAWFLPVVAPRIGGIQDFLDDDQLVDSSEDVAGYVASINRILNNESLADGLLKRQHEKLRRRTRTFFFNSLSAVGGYMHDPGNRLGWCRSQEKAGSEIGTI